MDIDSKQCWHNLVKFRITTITHDLNFQVYKWDRIATTYPKYNEKNYFLDDNNPHYLNAYIADVLSYI